MLLHLDEEIRTVKKELDFHDRKQLVSVKDIIGATPEEVFKTIRVWEGEEKLGSMCVFHYGGHATGDNLILNTQKGDASGIKIQGLAKALGEIDELKLIFLNGCSTLKQVSVFLDHGAKAVIATATKINDEHATKFAECFYQNLAEEKRTIEESYEEARKLILSYIDEDKVLQARNMFTREKKKPGDELPWGLYLNDTLTEEDKEKVLSWRLPENEETSEEKSTEKETTGVPSVAKFQCNRTKQADRFHHDYKKKRRSKQKVQFIFIHGPEQQGHNGLFERFAQDNIPRYYEGGQEEESEYDDKTTIEKYFRIESSEDEEIAQEKLLTGLFELFETPFDEIEDDPFDQPLERLLTSNSLENKKCVSVHAKVTNTAWKKHTGSFIRWILDTFQKEAKDLPDDAPDILIFFSVIYEEEEGGVMNKIKFWNRKKGKRFSPKEILKTIEQFPDILILDELHPVEEVHVKDWMGKCAQKLENPSLINETIKKQYIENLKKEFDGEREWKMELLEPKLEAIISELNNDLNT
ncbi:MAG: CHAT domain-containing protein [Bacteroidota bacterium]